MKFEESSLTRYLVKNLEPLTEADPVILAEYVVALLRKDKPIKELEKLCAEKLFEFLGQGTKPFITRLFHALEDGSFVPPATSVDATEQVQPSPSLITEDQTEVELKNSSLKPEELSPSGCPSEDEKEVTDDDDDDRNHKHRRRENRSQSSDKDIQGQPYRRSNRKRNRPFENGQVFLGSDPQASENQKEYNPDALERDLSTRFEKRRPGLVPSFRPAYDMGLRTKANQAFRNEPGSRFDISTSLSRLTTGRGRGRGLVPWSQHDSKFSSVDTFDFSSQMAPQGPGFFAGRGLPSFGLLPGMANGGLDTLHPHGLQGPINQSFGIVMPRQRCRDFEERGFCLRGDMCPMEHGVNRIVVEDVQSLSQFNLPVSLPSAHLLGTPGGALPSSGGPSSLLSNSKSLHGKSSKPGATDDGLSSNRVLSTSAGGGEADLYDPDQPLWNNDQPERSSALVGLSSSKIDDAEMSWNADFSGRNNFRLSDSFDSTVGSQSTSSTVWGRIGNSGNRSDVTGKFDSTVASLGYLENEANKCNEPLPFIPGTVHHRKKIASEDAGPKTVKSAGASRMRSDPLRNKTSQKALRTLFVNGIPLKNNKRDALLSHFQKFGEVIDIYIPLNSERAFVQFSKREEAEAALKAPDAVMGNRFIKLWWANRDSILDNNVGTGQASSATPSVAASTPPQASTVDKVKENLPSVGLKVTAAASSDVPIPTALNHRPLLTNVPKSAPPSQKKLENLELLKEQLRLKQEMLDQKRNEFRRQLDKLEKQATVKGDVTTEQSGKRHKVGMVTDVVKAATTKSTAQVIGGQRQGAEKTLDKDHSAESVVSPSSKTNSTATAVVHSPKSLKHQARPSVPLGSPFVANRFKLDNRPSTFTILPPLPNDFANVGVLKEHFSSFGDLSEIDLEEREANASSESSESSKNISARVTFTTRSSAERAFSNGKFWQGHNLKFSWLVVSSKTSNEHSGKENYPTPLNGVPDVEVSAETSTSGSSSTMEKATCIGSQAAASTENGALDNSKAIKGSVEPMDQSEACHSSQTTSPSCGKLSSVAETMSVEDGLHAKSVQ